MECRHLDGNPANNALKNLRWDSLSENRKDRNRHGIWNCGEAHPMAKLRQVDVDLIRSRCARGEAQRLVASAFNISQSHVSDIVNGKYWST
jgi:hypothetical protein